MHVPLSTSLFRRRAARWVGEKNARCSKLFDFCHLNSRRPVESSRGTHQRATWTQRRSETVHLAYTCEESTGVIGAADHVTSLSSSIVLHFTSPSHDLLQHITLTSPTSGLLFSCSSFYNLFCINLLTSNGLFWFGSNSWIRDTKYMHTTYRA